MIRDIISKIVEEWFLLEPALFQAYCSHELTENSSMPVPLRCGQMRIEYNPDMLKEWSEKMIAQRLKLECVRILLGHPYQRQPFKARKGAISLGSDLTIRDNYYTDGILPIPQDMHPPKGLAFEEYYALALKLLYPNPEESPYEDDQEGDGKSGGCDSSGNGKGKSVKDDDSKNTDRDGNDENQSDESSDEGQSSADSGQKSNSQSDGSSSGMSDEKKKDKGAGEMEMRESSAELWEEDQLAQEQIRTLVENIKRTKQWGSLPGSLQDCIIASAIVKIDYRRVLSIFRATVLSSKRRLTRMIPSRRYGFQYMGSKRDFCTNLLVAIDVSGSVENNQISQALSIINRFFKYGVENIDVIQFDTEIHGEKESFKKDQRKYNIHGRGGTDFQAAVDMFIKDRYDGLIMITDGYADKPSLPKSFHGHILWMIYENDCIGGSRGRKLDEDLKWINELPKNRYLILPPVA